MLFFFFFGGVHTGFIMWGSYGLHMFLHVFVGKKPFLSIFGWAKFLVPKEKQRKQHCLGSLYIYIIFKGTFFVGHIFLGVLWELLIN